MEEERKSRGGKERQERTEDTRLNLIEKGKTWAKEEGKKEEVKGGGVERDVTEGGRRRDGEITW